MKRNGTPEIMRAPKAHYRQFTFAPHVRRWLQADDLDPPDNSDSDEPDDPEKWDAWALSEMCDGPLFDFGKGILVDAALLRQRFACVSERCAPRPGRKRGTHSCCSDAEVTLVRAEVRRLSRVREALADYVPRKEPRLWPRLQGRNGRTPSFYLDESGGNLCRPGERCVFSKLDPQGRIRCHLWDVAEDMGVDRSEFQPYTCRVFPVSVTMLERGRVVAGVLTKKNYKHMGGDSPRRYPCLSDPTLPPLYETMRNDLDWIFGAGFAEALGQLARDRGYA